MRPNRGRYTEAILALLISGLLSAALSAGGFIGARQLPARIVLTGIVSDTTCGYFHGAGVRGDALCTLDCVSQGADFALAVEKKVYLLQGNRVTLDQFAGQTVVVKGTV